ncbi:50S ribosomal protein L17 [Acidobacteria bacterium AH-259-A15]|nr:50S ribosomal protein L17 [Acidobacteria bacterium AH-259-A15]
MRHRWSGRKLGRTSSHRMAMLRNMVTEFLDKERIITTVPKAKELRPFAEKIITLGKRETLHARRQALALVRKKSVVYKLFDTLAPRYADRNGGYTRIIRLGFRKGDNAEMALIELVESEPEASAAPEKKGKEAAAESKTGAKAKAES